jgi:flagellar assembly protein FliH
MGEMMADMIAGLIAKPGGAMAGDLTIVSAEQSAALKRWQIPVFDEPKPRELDGLHTAAQLDEIEAAAYQEGLQRGHAQGYADGQREARQEAERLRELIEHLQRPLAQINEDVERAVLDTACAIAKRLAQAELSFQPELIEQIVRTGLAALPSYARELSVYLHPDDAAFLETRPELHSNGQDCRIVVDASLQRGDCRIVTDSTRIDASLDARLATVRAALAADPR